MKPFWIGLAILALSLVAGCGDSAKDPNPGAPVEWNKNPNAPKGYGDPSQSGPMGKPKGVK